MIKKAATTFNQVVDFLCATMMLVMVAVVFLQVFFRYVLVSPLGWTEEVGIMTMIWTTFIGSYMAFRDNKHMRISLVYDRINPNQKRFVSLTGNILMIIMNIFIFIYGLNFVDAFKNMKSPYIGLPMKYVYSLIPIGAVLWTMQLLVDIWRIAAGGQHYIEAKGEG
ncbi:MAG: TRAP transporter small permease [Limnochordia bacterium]|jgi:TRAP-type C4-dicarboxylate transport system permease small subunit